MPRRYRRAVAFLVAAFVALPFASAGADPCTEARGPFTSTLPPPTASPIGVAIQGSMGATTTYYCLDTFAPQIWCPLRRHARSRTHGGRRSHRTAASYSRTAPAPFVDDREHRGGTSPATGGTWRPDSSTSSRARPSARTRRTCASKPSIGQHLLPAGEYHDSHGVVVSCLELAA
jgi:hypothetical protein